MSLYFSENKKKGFYFERTVHHRAATTSAGPHSEIMHNFQFISFPPHCDPTQVTHEASW